MIVYVGEYPIIIEQRIFSDVTTPLIPKELKLKKHIMKKTLSKEEQLGVVNELDSEIILGKKASVKRKIDLSYLEHKSDSDIISGKRLPHIDEFKKKKHFLDKEDLPKIGTKLKLIHSDIIPIVKPENNYFCRSEDNCSGCLAKCDFNTNPKLKEEFINDLMNTKVYLKVPISPKYRIVQTSPSNFNVEVKKHFLFFHYWKLNTSWNLFEEAENHVLFILKFVPKVIRIY